MKNVKRTEPEEIGFLPNFSSPRIISITFIGAILLAIMFTLVSTPRDGDLWNTLPALTLFMVCIAIGIIVVLNMARKILARLQPQALAVSCYCLSLLVTYAASVLALWTGEGNLISDHESILWNFFVLRNLLICSIVCAVSLRYFYVQHQWKSNIQTEARSRIQALQARIRPHFLFNSMNTIASLTVSDPHKAEKAVLDLADLFRASLGQQDRIPLEAELNFIRRYIDIEALRLGERLKIEFNLQDNLSLNTLVPALIIQPLVENAIYHGIEPLTSGGTVKIAVASTPQGLTISVTNPIPQERDPKRSGNKMAQDNIRQRLQLAYGGQARMVISATEQDYTASFNIPLDAK